MGEISPTVLIIVLVCVTRGLALSCTNNTSIGDTHRLEVSISSPASLCIQLNNSVDLEPIRVSVESVDASSRHPVLVTVRQPLGIDSWTLPYVESGFAFSSVQRTLCPLLNNDDNGTAILYIDLSTTEDSPVSVTLSTTLVAPFKLQMSTPVEIEATPTGPSYLLFEYNDPPLFEHVRVNFRSEGNSSNVCAIASIQTAYCPVMELLDNPNHRGRFQTMRSIASITARENDTEPHFGFFYIVLSVLPDDGPDGSCVSTRQGLGDELIVLRSAVNNFNPTPYNGTDRTKRVTITVEPVNPNQAAAYAVPVVVYFLFMAIAMVWNGIEVMRRKRKKRTKDNNQTNVESGKCSPSGGLGLNDTTESSNGSSHPPSAGDSQEGNVDNAPSSQPGAKFKINLPMSELESVDDSSAFQKEHYHFALYLLVIIVFYSIPAFQLAITYQKVLSSSGNEDICYYNNLCAQPHVVDSRLTLSAFNNLFSNIGYFFLGALFIFVALWRRYMRYRSLEEHNTQCEKHEKKGVPQTFGLFIAIGLAMIAQGCMSVAYHLCPSTTNYQLDATFMYVMMTLGMIKVLTSRAPDLNPSLHRQALFLMIIILVVVFGGLWYQSLPFKIVFMVLYWVVALQYCVEVYYRWQIKANPRAYKELIDGYRKQESCKPQHPCKFIAILIALILNFVGAALIFVASAYNIDFARYFVGVLLLNFVLFFFYYMFGKCCHGEYSWDSLKSSHIGLLKPLFYIILAFVSWAPAIYFFLQNVTDTSVSPALSRDRNRDCLVFGFYDSHDLWHFLSAFALYFSFIILVTFDEGQEEVPRTNIKTL